MVFEPPEPVLAKLTTKTLAGNHRGRVVRKDAGYRCEIAYVAIDHAEERDHGGLVGGAAVEVAHRRASYVNACIPARTVEMGLGE